MQNNRETGRRIKNMQTAGYTLFISKFGIQGDIHSLEREEEDIEVC